MLHITRTESSDFWAVVLPCNSGLFPLMHERIMMPACDMDIHKLAQAIEACCNASQVQRFLTEVLMHGSGTNPSNDFDKTEIAGLNEVL
jgi:hypothetical protein